MILNLFNFKEIAIPIQIWLGHAQLDTFLEAFSLPNPKLALPCKRVTVVTEPDVEKCVFLIHVAFVFSDTPLFLHLKWKTNTTHRHPSQSVNHGWLQARRCWSVLWNGRGTWEVSSLNGNSAQSQKSCRLFLMNRPSYQWSAVLNRHQNNISDLDNIKF